MTLPLAALRERIPGLAGRRVARVDEGWDFDVYVVDDEWIVRVPRRPAVARRVPPEAALLDLLAPALPVAIQRYEAVGNGVPWVAYRRLEGEPLAAGASAADVAAFLSALHAFPVESAAAAGIPAGEWRAAMAEQLAEFELHVLPLLEPSERREAERAFRRYLEDDARFAFRPALIHADLGLEHLLCGSDGRLRAVIDWSDARIGDAALDLTALLHDLGPQFAADLLGRYEHEADMALAERARFYRLLRPWHEVVYGVSLERPEHVESGLAGIRERLG